MSESKSKRALASMRSLLGRSVFVAVGIIGAMFVLFEVFTVRIRPGTMGVLQNNLAGGISDRDLDVGYHFLIPGVHRVYLTDSRYFFLNFSVEDDLGDEYEPLQIRTEGNNSVTVDATIPVRIVPGRAHAVVGEGLHVGEAYRVRAHNTIVGVLQQHLAALTSEEWYNVDMRTQVRDQTLVALNESLGAFHLEAEQINLRSFRFSENYESQLGQIQLLEQQQLLDRSQERLSNSQQQLDNFANETQSLLNQRTAWWATQLAIMESAYRNGIGDAGRDEIVDSFLEVLLVNRRNDIGARGILPGTPAYDEYVATARGEIAATLANEHFVLGIEGVNALTNREVAQIDGRREALGPRYQAEADQIIETIVQDGQRQVNELLSRPGGRALVALEAARNLRLSEQMTFPAGSLPFLLDLDRLAGALMGR